MLKINLAPAYLPLLIEAVECRYEAAVMRYEDGQDSNEDMEKAEAERRTLLNGLGHYLEH